LSQETAELKSDSDGLTKATVSYWTGQTSDGPMRIFECVYKGKSIVKYRKRLHITAQHVETLHQRFRQHAPAFVNNHDKQAGAAVRKRVFLRCHLYVKMIILPSQARDNPRESSTQKWTRFCRRRGKEMARQEG
jgi:hypothetical protein